MCFTDELSGFRVFFGSFLKQQLYSNVDKPYGDGIFRINVIPPLNISTITVTRNNNTVNVSLTICEVEVYEGKYILLMIIRIGLYVFNFQNIRIYVLFFRIFK